jgi:hypothetical protein
MTRKPQREVRSRREFLRGVATAAGGSVAVAVSGVSLAEEPDGQLAQKSQPKGYRLTPHIRTYYDKARI